MHRRALAALAALAFVLVWAAPASAAAPKVGFFVKSYTIAPGSGATIYTMLFADRNLPLARNAVTIRYSFIGQDPAFKLNEAGHPNNCSVAIPDRLVLDCGAAVDALTPAGVDSGVVGFLDIAADAVPGTRGTLTATMTVKGYAPITRTSTVTVGEAIALTPVDGEQERSAAPGAPIDHPLTLTNSGTATAQGVALLSGSQYAFDTRTRYSNCFYTADSLSGCTFDQPLAPGETYRVTLPLRVRADTYAPSVQYGSWQWATDEEFADLRQYALKGGFGPIGTPGRGGVLRLTPVVTAKAGPPQALPEYTVHGLKLTVTGKQSADLAAVGGRASGRKGSVVSVSVGLRDLGPASIDHSRIFGSKPTWPTTRVYVPKGATAVRVPSHCKPMTSGGGVLDEQPGRPGQARYSCDFYSLLKVGGTVTFDFGFRIDQVITGARGGVAVAPSDDEINQANNSATIVLNPAAPADGGSGGNGGGGGLPITGPSALAGLVLVAAGAVALLITRRRTS
ncbi:hypothetical protein KOI35_44195 [Actinoplanes bogorensis]|uniref:Gram-positive cocci surface proteins LPxTG domain-containing protein n=1 Tax=Paractinoplanes bogorensis TaxID=1610840 RepID=A0ABS5Z4B6_9ACTN|nr:hypothetical protein [Actinoplanes bogorensis]MBU2670525.1 hypothetical protein [Actinoplanes bogorensis]